jgi:hypothetical protein
MVRFEKVKEGLWTIVGRGRVELDRGTYFIGTDNSDDRWTDEELFQIAVFISDQWKNRFQALSQESQLKKSLRQ